jgi:hypothetical protein
MLPEILLGLFRVPFEHGLEYMYACAYSASPGKAAVQQGNGADGPCVRAARSAGGILGSEVGG